VPTGALIGLDAVTAAAVGIIYSVQIATRKPVEGLAGTPYVVKNNIDIEGITEPLKIFDGTAREAAKGFPANTNVAAALPAEIGPDRPRVLIWADPTVSRNVHRIEVDSRLGSFFYVDRKCPIRKSQDKPYYGSLGYRLPSQVERLSAHRNVTSALEYFSRHLIADLQTEALATIEQCAIFVPRRIKAGTNRPARKCLRDDEETPTLPPLACQKPIPSA
jgi:hypothetical protein